MCLLFVTNPNGCVPKDKFKSAWTTNSDGFGLMWADDGKVIVRKTQKSVDAAWDLYQSAPKDRIVVGHFRFGTSGKKDKDNVHPFPINNDLWLAHNGVMSIKRDVNADMSDTWHFVHALKDVVSDYDTLKLPGMQRLINEVIGAGNKLAILAADGRCIIFGEQLGSTIENVWYSNTYSLYRSSGSYSSHGYGNYYAGGTGYGARRWRNGKWEDYELDEAGDEIVDDSTTTAQGEACALPAKVEPEKKGELIPIGATKPVSTLIDGTTGKVIPPRVVTHGTTKVHGKRKNDPNHYRSSHKGGRNAGPRNGTEYAKWWAQQNLVRTDGSVKLTLSEVANLSRAEIKSWIEKNPWSGTDMLFDLIHGQ